MEAELGDHYQDASFSQSARIAALVDPKDKPILLGGPLGVSLSRFAG